MKLKEGFRNSLFFFLLLPLLGYSKIDLFSLREKEEIPLVKPEIEKEAVIKEEVKEPEKRRIIKPKERSKKPPLPKEEIATKEEIETQTGTIEEETIPFEIFEKGQIEEEEKRPLWVVFSLAITSFSAIILIFLIIIHLTKRERRVYRPSFQVPPSDIEEELKNLKQSSKIVSSQIEDIENSLPKEFVEELRSGKVFSQIAKDISASFEPRIRELGLAYQAIKKSLAQLDSEIAELSSLKGLNFKDIARQTATEFIMPLKNEFEKARLSYENIISSFEQRQDGRLSTIEKKYIETKESVNEVYKRLIGLESLITSATIFEQEPIIRTKKREDTTPPPQTPREELNKIIYELADSGLGVDDIAKKTKIGKGEISLILSFRKKEK